MTSSFMKRIQYIHLEHYLRSEAWHTTTYVNNLFDSITISSFGHFILIVLERKVTKIKFV